MVLEHEGADQAVCDKRKRLESEKGKKDSNKKPVLVASMRELAPLVAATIRDSVVIDQSQEIKELRAQLKSQALELKLRRELVAITGPKGSPIYAKVSNHPFINDSSRNNSALRRSDVTEAILGEWPEEMILSEEQSCTLGDLLKSEVYLSGLCMGPLLDMPIKLNIVAEIDPENDDDQDPVDDWYYDHNFEITTLHGKLIRFELLSVSKEELLSPGKPDALAEEVEFIRETFQESDNFTLTTEDLNIQILHDHFGEKRQVKFIDILTTNDP